jgi:hypothetical protein
MYILEKRVCYVRQFSDIHRNTVKDILKMIATVHWNNVEVGVKV